MVAKPKPHTTQHTHRIHTAKQRQCEQPSKRSKPRTEKQTRMGDGAVTPKPPSIARKSSTGRSRDAFAGPRSSSGSNANSTNNSRRPSAMGRRTSRHMSSRGTSSNNRKEKPSLKYLDDEGNDVTPRSLLNPQRRKTLEDVRLERNSFLDSLSSVKDVSW